LLYSAANQKKYLFDKIPENLRLFNAVINILENKYFLSENQFDYFLIVAFPHLFWTKNVLRVINPFRKLIKSDDILNVIFWVLKNKWMRVSKSEDNIWNLVDSRDEQLILLYFLCRLLFRVILNIYPNFENRHHIWKVV